MNKMNLTEELKKGWIFEIENCLLSYQSELFVVETFEFLNETKEKQYSVKDGYATLKEALININR